VSAQEIRLRLPQGFRPAKLTLLNAQKEVPFRVTNSEIRFTVPQVAEYEVAVVIRS
jgi:hypothetical protein